MRLYFITKIPIPISPYKSYSCKSHAKSIFSMSIIDK